MKVTMKKGTYEECETGDGGKGCGDGGGGEGKRAEMANEHDGDDLERVLEEAHADEWSREPTLLLHLFLYTLHVTVVSDHMLSRRRNCCNLLVHFFSFLLHLF